MSDGHDRDDLPLADPGEGYARPHESDRERRTRRTMTWIFAVVIFTAGLAFFYKLYEFMHDLLDAAGLQFAGAHLLTYVLVAGGFFCLLAFAFLRGHFSDIEKPKFDLLEKEVRYDREGVL